MLIIDETARETFQQNDNNIVQENEILPFTLKNVLTWNNQNFVWSYSMTITIFIFYFPCTARCHIKLNARPCCPPAGHTPAQVLMIVVQKIDVMSQKTKTVCLCDRNGQKLSSQQFGLVSLSYQSLLYQLSYNDKTFLEGGSWVNLEQISIRVVSPSDETYNHLTHFEKK